MVWNQKLVFRIFLGLLILVFSFIFYFAFISDDADSAERIFVAIGFDSSESAEDNPAVPLPPGSVATTGSGSSAGGGGSSGSGTGNGVENNLLSFCTFDALHTITSEVPCRCGFSGVCYEEESVCDATFNNGEGYCS
jgi:hypothetical protein